MSVKRSKFLGPAIVLKRPSTKNKLKGRRSLVTSWFASPGELLTDDLASSPREDKRKSSGEECPADLRKQTRDFGSAGDLLSTEPRPLSESYKSYLGKSLQQLPTSSGMTSEVGPFRTETGSECQKGEICNLQPLDLHKHALLENPESETRWYFKYFLGKYHLNYLCNDFEKNPLFLSVVPSDSIYRCILWRKTGNKRLCVKHSSNGRWPSPKSIMEKFSVRVDRGFKEIISPSIQKDLLTLEEQEGAVNFKFGVIYAKAGQRQDDDMYCNEHGSERFHQFLELLGDEVQLHGWQQFRGGLDNKNDSTGLSSVYTVFEGHEIMFHVSTLLPYTSANQQQLERKRHIGNDIVVIIYVDYETDPEEAYRSAIMNFDPDCMRSHFNHIFALVTYNHVTENYRLVIHTAESVPTFGPPLPTKGQFSDFAAFRDFLLAKLINGEKAAYCTPTFSQKRERTLGLLLKEVEKNYSQEMRRAVSTPALNMSPSAFKKFNEKEQIFTAYGQRLKVDKIITGLHPTSQRTTATKKEPWETECMTGEFPYKISCGDVCDDGIFIVHTPTAGTYFIYRDGSYSLIIDQSVMIGQLVVAHRHQVLLFRTNHPKEVNYMYAIPLKQFYNDSFKSVATKSSLSRYHVPHSKNVSLFCTSHLSDQFLRLAVAVKNKVYMLAYKHAATMVLGGSPVTPVSSIDPKDNFIKHRELILLDIPAHMTLLDERPSGKLCVTYHKLTVVDAIDEIRATTQRIPNLDIAKTKLTTLTSVQANGRSELLIGYNLTCQLITLHESTAYNSVEIVWNTEPQDLVYMPPYMLAFTEHTVEIRMASNGSLMQTISVPDLKLLSSKGDLYFTSSSNMVHTASFCKTPTSARSYSHLPTPTKLPKNFNKKDLMTTSGRFSESEESTYIYKISLESMTGRRDFESSVSILGSTTSLHHSSSEESVCKNEGISAISDDGNSDGSVHQLDFIHPIVGDGEVPLVESSFQEEASPANSLHRKVRITHLTSSPRDSEEDSPVNSLRRKPRAHFNPSPRDSGEDDSPVNSLQRKGNTIHFSPSRSQFKELNGIPILPSHLEKEFYRMPARHRSMEGPLSGGSSPSLKNKVSAAHSCSKLRRRKVITSRKSLDATSRWLYPYFTPADDRLSGEMMGGGPMRSGGLGTHDVPEVLGTLENVVYSSPDSGIHDLSLSSNYSETSSNVNGGREPHR